ncbi:MAG: dynamin family protein [Oculatellaceae cyanobacterium Prado106]|jgi:hypothetical protein|nr:dynamin family protein [Oculatellaceae cyanobacterium Prado106]
MHPRLDSDLLNVLKTAIALLELPVDHPWRRDVEAIEQYVASSSFRIAVFAPFNYGKSTLLNALLGEKALPIGLIPTTGAAITVKYGDTLSTQIRLVDGTVVDETGTDVLERYAVLDDQRQMNQNVSAVEVRCPHPFLQTGVELMDLPGTDDREAQDALVKQQLLTANLIVQVLDARKLMTLQERENLRDWLLNRGIETVLFVVNFLNLLEPDDQKQVMNRLRFVAESFRSKLPTGVSNLYRVDALPALRARLKGDMAAAQSTGLPMLESALQTIVRSHLESASSASSPQSSAMPSERVKAIARPIQQALQGKIEAIAADLTESDQSYTQRLEIQQKAQGLLKQGFTTSVNQLRDWLSPAQLIAEYEASAINALREFEFETWGTDGLRADWLRKKQAVTEWVYKACEFFDHPRPADLWVAFPSDPEVVLPNIPKQPGSGSSSSSSTGDAAPVAIATGLGWVLGGPIGAAVLGGASYILKNTELNKGDRTDFVSPESQMEQINQAYCDAAQQYLRQFSSMALTALTQYETEAAKVFRFEQCPAPVDSSAQQYQLQLLQNVLESITTLSQ